MFWWEMCNVLIDLFAVNESCRYWCSLNILVTLNTGVTVFRTRVLAYGPVYIAMNEWPFRGMVRCLSATRAP